jgi:hypothetical protein
MSANNKQPIGKSSWAEDADSGDEIDSGSTLAQDIAQSMRSSPAQPPPTTAAAAAMPPRSYAADPYGEVTPATAAAVVLPNLPPSPARSTPQPTVPRVGAGTPQDSGSSMLRSISTSSAAAASSPAARAPTEAAPAGTADSSPSMDAEDQQPTSKQPAVDVERETARIARMMLRPESEAAKHERLRVIQADPNSRLSSVKSFNELDLKPELLRAVATMGFEKPSRQALWLHCSERMLSLHSAVYRRCVFAQLCITVAHLRTADVHAHARCCLTAAAFKRWRCR